MESYAETISAERVKRVMNGYADKEATGVSFDLYELGEPLFNEDGTLNEAVSIEKIRQYIFYTETQTALINTTHSDNPYLLDVFNHTAYYFIYEPGTITTLNHGFLSRIQTKAEQYIIYADNSVLTKDFMAKRNIILKKYRATSPYFK